MLLSPRNDGPREEDGDTRGYQGRDTGTGNFMTRQMVFGAIPAIQTVVGT